MQRLHLEIGKCATALGVLCFPPALFFHSGYLTIAVKAKASSEFVW